MWMTAQAFGSLLDTGDVEVGTWGPAHDAVDASQVADSDSAAESPATFLLDEHEKAVSEEAVVQDITWQELLDHLHVAGTSAAEASAGHGSSSAVFAPRPEKRKPVSGIYHPNHANVGSFSCHMFCMVLLGDEHSAR